MHIFIGGWGSYQSVEMHSMYSTAPSPASWLGPRVCVCVYVCVLFTFILFFACFVSVFFICFFFIVVRDNNNFLFVPLFLFFFFFVWSFTYVRIFLNFPHGSTFSIFFFFTFLFSFSMTKGTNNVRDEWFISISTIFKIFSDGFYNNIVVRRLRYFYSYVTPHKFFLYVRF